MSQQPAQTITEQISDLGVGVTANLHDSARSMWAMAAELEDQAARLREIGNRVQSRGDNLNPYEAADLNLDRITTAATDAVFGALNTVTLAARAEQAIGSAHRAKEGAMSIQGLLDARTAQS